MKIENLKNRLKELKTAAIAFSAGVDSAFLLKVAHDTLFDNAIAITAALDAMPEREIEEAKAFCKKEKIKHIIIKINQLEIENFVKNPLNRCYYCKSAIFEKIINAAKKEGISNVLEGSNLDDTKDFRPGMKALDELKILSPLKEAGFTKEEIRFLAKDLGLSCYNKPSFACLASRIPFGETITKEKLIKIEKAENFLSSLGFSQFRARLHCEIVRLEIPSEEFSKILDPIKREKITNYLKTLGFKFVTLDLEGYRTGSLNKL